jgi:hypothetical protein
MWTSGNCADSWRIAASTTCTWCLDALKTRQAESSRNRPPSRSPISTTDIHAAVAAAYEAVRGAMVPGGYLVFDDATVSSCLGATEVVETLAIRRDGLSSEQIYPHFVFRAP